MKNTLTIFCITLFCSTTSFSHPGVGIVMDSKGNIYYTDLKQVWKIDTRGNSSIAVPHVHTHELYLDKNDNLFGEHLWYEGEATDKWGHYVWKRDRAGKIEKVISDQEGFLTNYSFVRDDEHMFWADRTSDCQKIIGKSNGHQAVHSPACFKDIRWMTTSPRGNIYLIDKTDIKKIAPDGTVEILASQIAERKLTQFTVNDNHLAMGLWIDKQENVYVAIYGGRMVKKITLDKKISVVAETPMRWSPTGGLVAPNGDYWLLECSPLNEVRVERIFPGGARVVYQP